MISRMATHAPLLLLGLGLGAFLDGIVFHQVLQWHHLVVEYRPASDLEGLQYNTLWDGLFHLAAWAVVLVALLWLVAGRVNLAEVGARGVAGGLLLGWGTFNIADQILFHMVLGAHHIRMVDNYLFYDAAYTLVDALLVVGGWKLARGAGRSARNVTPSGGVQQP